MGGPSGAVKFEQYVSESHHVVVAGALAPDGIIDDMGAGIRNVLDELTGLVPNNFHTAGGANPYNLNPHIDPATAIAEFETAISDHKTWVDALAAQSDWADFADEVIAKAQAGGTFREINPITLGLNSQNIANGVVAGGIAAISHGIDPVSNFNSFATTSKTKYAAIISDIDVTAVAAEALTNANSAIAGLITAAQAVIDADLISDLTDAFVLQASYERERQINRFTSTMADMNAVNGSAFMFGLAILHAQDQQSVDDFTAKTLQQQYGQALQAAYTLYASQLQANANLESLNKQMLDNLISQGVASMVQIQNGEITYNQAIIRTYTEAFAAYIASAVRSEVMNSMQVAQFVSSQPQIIGSLRQLEATFRDATVTATGEAQKLDIAATSDYIDREIDRQVKDEWWVLDTLHQGVQVIGALTVPGGGGMKPSPVGSIAGGMLTGAAAGSKLPLPGGVGMAAGALLGGISGYLNG